jgi:hypothetical protein
MMTREGIAGEGAILFGFYFVWNRQIAMHGLNKKKIDFISKINFISALERSI